MDGPSVEEIAVIMNEPGYETKIEKMWEEAHANGDGKEFEDRLLEGTLCSLEEPPDLERADDA